MSRGDTSAEDWIAYRCMVTVDDGHLELVEKGGIEGHSSGVEHLRSGSISSSTIQGKSDRDC